MSMSTDRTSAQTRISEELTEEQLNDIRNAFNVMDRDGDGVINAKDLLITIRSLGEQFTEAELQDIINEIDTEGTGTINFKGFISVMQQRLRDPNHEQDTIEAFLVFDQDGDGFVTIREFQQVMSNIGTIMTDEEVEELIREYDEDGDVMLNFEEFHALLTAR